MRKAIDRTGMRYGKLLVLGKAPTEDARTSWKCLCDCGRTVVIRATHIGHVNGTKSCGCLKKEAAVLAGKKRRSIRTKAIEEAKQNRIDTSLRGWGW